MKKSLFLLLCVSFYANAQKFSKLEKISGHYKTLNAISPKAQLDSIDRQNFAIELASPKLPLKLKLQANYLFLNGSDFILPEFPSNSSLQTKAEIDFLKELEKNRTLEQIERSKFLAGVFYNVNTKPGDSDYKKMQENLFYMARQVEGFNVENLPITAQMMRKVWNDCTYYFWFHKIRFNRARPYTIDKTLKPIDTGTNFQAYPSGHSSASYVAANIYQELMPTMKAVFQSNAYEMGFSREIIGVHFPSDTEAGRIFAKQFVNQLFKNDKFIADFKKSKIEIDNFLNNTSK